MQFKGQGIAMTAKKFGIVLCIGLMSLCVRAADRTWTGGGGNANWSTPANWGGTVPTTNDTLSFSGTTQLASTNDLPDDTPFAGITFSSDAGAFTLSGKRIVLVGNVTNLSTSASAQTINLDMSLPETRVFYGSFSNGAIKINGALSGAGGLTKAGSQPLTLAASNSYDGVTTVNDGMLWITHGNALGSTNGNTVLNSKTTGGFLQLSGNIIVPEPLTLFGQCPTGGGAERSLSSLFNLSGSNTWSGAIFRQSDGNNTRIHVKSGSYLNITGGVTGSSAGLFVMNVLNATLAFYGEPVNIGTDRPWTENAGTLVFGATGNVWGDPPNLGNGFTVRSDIANALSTATPVRLGTSLGDSVTLNLNGFDQTVGRLYSYPGNPGTRVITSAAPATLTVDQGSDTLLDARLTGKLALIKTGAGTLSLSNSVANTTTTTGDITVSNGTLVAVLPASLGNSTNITVAGGTLELQTSSAIVDSARLSITNAGAKVKIGDGLTETVDKLFLNGVQQASGTWGTTASGAAHPDDAHFAGNGKVFVMSAPPITAVDATWDAEGGDTLLSTATNWTGDTLPAFDGTTHAIFGTGGATATVDTAVSLYGITFNCTNNFTVASGAGSIVNGLGGITAASPTTASRTYTLAEDLTLAENQTWCITNNGAGVTTLTVPGSIGNHIDPFGFTKTGNGALTLSGSNSYDGVTYLNNGLITISHANALGSTNGGTIGNGGWIQMNGGITVAEPVTLSGDASTSWAGGLRTAGGSNVWSGKITSSALNSRIQCNGGSLDIIGGIEGGQMCLGGSGGTYLRVSEKPINTPNNSFFAHTSILIILAVTNNAWTSFTISGNYVRMDMENVLPVASTINLGEGNMTVASGVDLNGHNQTIGQLTSYTNNTILNVFSQTPATLTVNQTVSSTFNGNITGLVSLVKMGSGRLTLTRASSTFGSFIVSNGTLAVSGNGTLGVNSTNVVVAGGTLSLSNSVAIANTAALTIANGGSAKVDLSAGVNETVGYLYFGDRQQRAGTYSATSGSGIQVTDATHFSGTGILTVLHDSAGTVISLR